MNVLLLWGSNIWNDKKQKTVCHNSDEKKVVENKNKQTHSQ